MAVWGAVIGYLVWSKLAYKHIVIVNDLANNTETPKICKARNYYDKKRALKLWKLAKERDMLKKWLPVPPIEAIKRNEKGKLFVEVWRTENGEYIFKHTKVTIRERPPELFRNVPHELLDEQDMQLREKRIEEWRQMQLNAWKRSEGIDIVVSPVTTNQRIIHYSILKDAHERKQKTWLDYIPLIMPVIMVFMMIIFVVVVLIFWKDLTTPGIDMQREKTAQQEIQLKIVQKLEDIDRGVQRIEPKQEVPQG